MDSVKINIPRPRSTNAHFHFIHHRPQSQPSWLGICLAWTGITPIGKQQGELKHSASRARCGLHAVSFATSSASVSSADRAGNDLEGRADLQGRGHSYALGVEDSRQRGQNSARRLVGVDLLKFHRSVPGHQCGQHSATGDGRVGVEEEELAAAIPAGRDATEHVRLAPEGVREQHHHLQKNFIIFSVKSINSWSKVMEHACNMLFVL